jgi:Domain of unknown function (DUF6468)
MLTLAVDGLIVALLLAALVLGLRLQQSLRGLRRGNGEMTQLIEALGRASGRAEAALDGLRQTAASTSERLARDVAGAQRLLDDLRFLSERGEQLADRLEEQIRRARPIALREPSASRAPAASRAVTATARAGEAGELERALRTLR